MRLQPAYVEDVVEAIVRLIERAEAQPGIFECGGPRVFSYEEFVGIVARQAGLAPILIPIPFAVWHALAWASEILPAPLLTRNQVELMEIDTVSSPEMPGFVELGISPRSVEVVLQQMQQVRFQLKKAPEFESGRRSSRQESVCRTRIGSIPGNAFVTS
jgi:NADH dehydrogenase